MRTTAGLLVLAACGATPAPAPTPVTSPPPAATAAPDPHNLGFEQVDGDRPAGWHSTVKEYEVRAARDVVHGGMHSLQIRRAAEAGFGPTMRSLEAAPYAGKKVRLTGWIKTAGAGGAALWIRADVADGDLQLDNMQGRRISGDRDWTMASVEVQVPANATGVVIGAMLLGGGTAWFDDLQIVVLPGPREIVLGGVVVDPGGAPVAGAEVSLIAPDHEIARHVTTDARGRFALPATTGRWGLSAIAKSHVGAFLAQADYPAARDDLRIALARDGVTIRGKLVPAPATPWFVELAAVSENDADLWKVPVIDGTFEAKLPRSEQYLAVVLDGGTQIATQIQRTGDVVDVELAMPSPPSEAVVAHVAQHAIPLATTEPGSGIADLAPLGKLVGNARIVALGEATHGTREFFQLKHRFLEYLVEQHGFTLFAIEANQPECRAIDDYILYGKGSARAALAGIYFWTWNTEEVLAMIEWMRAWNADPKHVKKLRFVGFDMQTTKVAHANVVAFATKVAPERAGALLAPIAVLGESASAPLINELTKHQRASLVGGLDTLAATFDGERTAWTRATTATAFADARHDLEILRQATRKYLLDPEDFPPNFEARDLAMADNIRWLLDQHPRARMVVWAHNVHVANQAPQLANMGGHLRARYRRDYLNFGFVFGEGSFQAMTGTPRKPRELREHRLGPPPSSHASAAFSRTTKPLLVLDLRSLPRSGPVQAWFAAPHAVRETGAGFTNESAMTGTRVLPELYDAVIYVDKTTRARPVK